MIQWRIYYADGDFFDDTMGRPKDAPNKGVAVIVQRHYQNNIQRIRYGAMYYYKIHPTNFTIGYWFAATETGIIDQFCKYPNLCLRMLRGETVHNDVWEYIWQKAVNDPDFPQRAGGKDPLEKPYNDEPEIIED